MRISDWSSDVCSSDLAPEGIDLEAIRERAAEHADDAQALSTNVRQRAEALTEDAQTIQGEAQANRAAYADSIDATGTDAVLDFEIGRASCRERVCQYV